MYSIIILLVIYWARMKISRCPQKSSITNRGLATLGLNRMNKSVRKFQRKSPTQMVVTRFVESYDSIKSDLPIKSACLEGHALKGFTSSQFFPAALLGESYSEKSAVRSSENLQRSPRDLAIVGGGDVLSLIERTKQMKENDAPYFRTRRSTQNFSDDRSRDTCDKFLSRYALSPTEISILIFVRF